MLRINLVFAHDVVFSVFNSRQTRPGYFHTRHRAVNQEVDFYFRRKRKPPFLPQYLESFSIFFLEIRDKLFFDPKIRICRPEGILRP